LFRSQIFFLFLITNISLFSQSIKSINEINQDFKVFSLSDSNKLNPLKFSVQIGEFNKLIDSENPISKYPLLYFKEKNSYKYFVGNYYNYSSAQMMSKMLIKDGLDKAFIICFGSLTETLISLVNPNESEDTLKTEPIQNKEIKGKDKETEDFSLNSEPESNTNPKEIKIANEINQEFKVLSVIDSNELVNPKFSVQIGVFKKLISLENPILKYPTFYLKTINNYKYFVGKYENLLSAKKMKKLLVLDGFSDAFIICFGAQKENIINDSNTIKLEENNILEQSDTLDISLETEQETNVQESEKGIQDEVANVQESEKRIQDEGANVQESETKIQDEGVNVQESETKIQDEGAKNLSLNSKTENKVNSQKIRIANKVDQDFQVFPLSDSNKLTSTKFSIQIGVFKNLIGLENPISKYQPLFYFQEKNIYKYFVGNFEDLSSAVSTKNLLVQDGLSNPHIVCFDAQKRDVSKNAKKQSETLVYRLGTFVENEKLDGTELNYIDKSSDIDEKIQKLRSLTNPSDPEQYTQNITNLDPTLRISGVSDSSQFKEVFYTVQLGAYSKPLQPPNYIFKFDLFMSEHNSLFKYYNGQFKTLNEARKKRDIFRLSGIYDAFVVAYGKPNKGSYLYDKEMKNIDKKININEKAQKSINLTNNSNQKQYTQNITNLDPTLRISGVSDSSQFKEVFFTIQLGAYSKPLQPPNYIFKFDLFMSKHNSLFKYYNGQFKTLNEARKQRDIYRLSGIYDAFVVAFGKYK